MNEAPAFVPLPGARRKSKMIFDREEENKRSRREFHGSSRAEVVVFSESDFVWLDSYNKVLR